jgi:hypothetical protein
MTLYAAYGSSMNPHWMAKRAPASPVFSSGWLEGWRLTFAGEDVGWDGALATVVEEPGDRVFVMVYDVPHQDEILLDAWEGAELGLWRKIRARIATLDGEQLAWMYALDAYEGGFPSTHYLEVIADAAQAAGAPSDYVARLLKHPCRPASAD